MLAQRHAELVTRLVRAYPPLSQLLSRLTMYALLWTAKSVSHLRCALSLLAEILCMLIYILSLQHKHKPCLSLLVTAYTCLTTAYMTA